ncbi:hypothetical protein [Barnesiella sp.]|uniref:hypothetical protein n=1 Tax=Barnesiella sp. TaxID=2033407 RepID=UPI002588872F|nr:hypothetical protein [Barnesiella sp.]
MKDNNSNNIETNNLTTEEFHKLLAENTAKLNELRFDYAQRMADAQDDYDKVIDKIIEEEYQEKVLLYNARQDYERVQKEYILNTNSLKKDRHEAGRKHNLAKASAKNHWATENEKIQSERHNIFERYRDSGGVLTGDTEGLLHPSWTRDKKGGMSDE